MERLSNEQIGILVLVILIVAVVMFLFYVNTMASDINCLSREHMVNTSDENLKRKAQELVKQDGGALITGAGRHVGSLDLQTQLY